MRITKGLLENQEPLLVRTELLSTRDALLELPTGGIDVGAARVADGGLHANVGQPADEVLRTKLRRGPELGPLDLVELNEVHVCERSLAEVAQCLKLALRVVDAPNQGVFIRGSPPGLVDVLAHDVIEVDK